jgi:hypothetical protein
MSADPETGLCGLGARYCVAMLPAMEGTTTVWLVKPAAPQDAESVAVMRRAIEQDGAREGSLIGECLDAARARGLSGEETYVFLAYQALLRLEETHERHIYLSDIAPFLESVPPPGVTAHMAARIAEHVRWLVRSAVDLALRLERAAAEFATLLWPRLETERAPEDARSLARSPSRSPVKRRTA